jgi:hypothetical protein
VAIANMGSLFLQSQGVKKAKPDWINPYPMLIEKQEALKIYDKEVCAVFMELSKEGKIPRWIFNEFTHELTLIKLCN